MAIDALRHSRVQGFYMIIWSDDLEQIQCFRVPFGDVVKCVHTLVCVSATDNIWMVLKDLEGWKSFLVVVAPGQEGLPDCSVSPFSHISTGHSLTSGLYLTVRLRWNFTLFLEMERDKSYNNTNTATTVIIVIMKFICTAIIKTSVTKWFTTNTNTALKYRVT